jgi:type II secretory pathway component PulC
MPKKQGLKKQRALLSREAREKVSGAALEHPDFGARRLSRFLRNAGIEAGEGSVRATLQKLNLHTRELRLKLLEERLLNENISLSEDQQRALHEFNPCLRERPMEHHFPGLLLIQDVIDLGALKNIGQTFLHTAVDPSCCLAFAVLSTSAEPANNISVLGDQSIPFYQQHRTALQAVVAGPGLAAGDPAYLRYLKSQGISLAQLPAGSGKNGFVERFEVCVRKDFLVEALQDQAIGGLEGLQAGFDNWLKRYNHTTPLPGYPTMGRPAMEVFRTAVRPAAETEPEPRAPARALADLSPRSLGKKTDRRPGREVWVFRALNAALVCLIAYFGWSVAWQFAGISEQQTGSAAEEGLQIAAPDRGKADIGMPLLPEDYKAIWDRNLFGVSAAAIPSAKLDKAAIEKIALASTDVGLRLIGTVVADDPKLNYAVIDIVATRDQGIFRERDRVGKAVIKSILRNTVIIETDHGDRRRLSVDEEPRKNAGTEQPLQALPAEVAATPAPPENIPAGDGTFQVSRNEVAASLSDIPRVIEESIISTPLNDGSPRGFHLGRLRAADALFRIGMRTGDVVKGVDDQEYGGPEDAELFLLRLAQGGHLSVLIERRGQPRKLDVLIE